MQHLTIKEIIQALELITEDVMELQGELNLPNNQAEKLIEVKTILSNVKYEMKGIENENS